MAESSIPSNTHVGESMRRLFSGIATIEKTALDSETEPTQTPSPIRCRFGGFLFFIFKRLWFRLQASSFEATVMVVFNSSRDCRDTAVLQFYVPQLDVPKES